MADEDPRPMLRAGPLAALLTALLVKNPDDRLSASKVRIWLRWLVKVARSAPPSGALPTQTPGSPIPRPSTRSASLPQPATTAAQRSSRAAPGSDITTTSNFIEHTTTFDDGRIHATFTQTGTFVAVPLEDPSLPSYTGKFTIWGGFNQNGKTVNGTFTFTAHGTGSDGSTFKNHVTEHFNERPDGTVNEFFHCH